MFVDVADPVGQGFVASLAHPGGTITGFTNYDPPMAGKWLEMLTQITPPVARVAVLYNPATVPYAGLCCALIEDAARSLAVSVRAAPVNDDAEIEAMHGGARARGARRIDGHAGAPSPPRIATPSSPSPPGTACLQSMPTASSPRSAG